jgi:hypothetical protein
MQGNLTQCINPRQSIYQAAVAMPAMVSKSG